MCLLVLVLSFIILLVHCYLCHTFYRVRISTPIYIIMTITYILTFFPNLSLFFLMILFVHCFKCHTFYSVRISKPIYLMMTITFIITFFQIFLYSSSTPHLLIFINALLSVILGYLHQST